MIDTITGIHHITAMASDAVANNTFFTRALGQRRVKKTVNFDAPDVYHLYYADRVGTPGTVMTYFPFPDIGRARRGTGEVGHIAYAVPEKALNTWARHYRGAARDTAFGEKRLHLTGPNGEAILLVASEEAVGRSGAGRSTPPSRRAASIRPPCAWPRRRRWTTCCASWATCPRRRRGA